MSLALERQHSHALASPSTPSRPHLGSSKRVQARARGRVVARSERLGEEAASMVVGTTSSTSGLAPPPIREDLVKTRYIAETLLPTRHGKFRLRGYKHSLDGGITFTEPTAIICGAVEGAADVPLRVHDACFTSEVLGSLKCDCAEQLELALEFIQSAGAGMIIYLQQEGRGIGLANKIAAYALQEQGLDTVDANRALGLPDDCREYTSVRNILRDLGVQSVRLMTNNPRKLDVLTQLGVRISGRIPCQVEAGEFNKGYLTAKRDRMDHLLDGSWCYWNHDGEPTQPSATAYSEGGMGLPPGLRDGQPPAGPDHTVALDEDEEGSSGLLQQQPSAAVVSRSSSSSLSASSQQPLPARSGTGNSANS